MANFVNCLRGLKFRKLDEGEWYKINDSDITHNWLGYDMFEVLGDSELPGELIRVWIKAWSEQEGEDNRFDIFEVGVGEFRELMEMYTLADTPTP